MAKAKVERIKNHVKVYTDKAMKRYADHMFEALIKLHKAGGTEEDYKDCVYIMQEWNDVLKLMEDKLAKL